MSAFSLNDGEFEQFNSFIYRCCGISFSSVNRPMLDAHIYSAMMCGGYESLQMMMADILSDESKRDAFIDKVTTNLTSFFRDTRQMCSFRDSVLPDLIAEKRCLKVWSAGCATGEEPYSLAMILQDSLPSSVDFHVFATDISARSISTAKRGFYPREKVEGIVFDEYMKYLAEKDGGYEISPEIKRRVTFSKRNLMRSVDEFGIDVAFCRNVMIYFDDVSRRTAVGHLHEALRPSGFLFLGHSESLIGVDSHFQFMNRDGICFYRRK